MPTNLCIIPSGMVNALLPPDGDHIDAPLRIRTVTGRRMQILEHEWRYHLCSPFWRLYVHNRSGAFIRHARATLDFLPHRIYLIPAWCRFETGVRQAVTQDYIHFYVHGFPVQFVREPIAIAPTPVVAGLAREWRREMIVESRAQLRPASEAFTPTQHCWMNALVEASLAVMFSTFDQKARRDFDQRRQRTEMQPALECLARRLDRPPANAELAALCKASEDYFIRRFRRLLGTTPARYGLDRRLDAAAEMLTDTAGTIDEIAEATGFGDRFHFSRSFKKRLGTSPAEYRRSHWETA